MENLIRRDSYYQNYQTGLFSMVLALTLISLEGDFNGNTKILQMSLPHPHFYFIHGIISLVALRQPLSHLGWADYQFISVAA